MIGVKDLHSPTGPARYISETLAISRNTNSSVQLAGYFKMEIEPLTIKISLLLNLKYACLQPRITSGSLNIAVQNTRWVGKTCLSRYNYFIFRKS